MWVLSESVERKLSNEHNAMEIVATDHEIWPIYKKKSKENTSPHRSAHSGAVVPRNLADKYIVKQPMTRAFK